MDPNRDQSTIQNAREEFDAHMVRLRDALATGNMTHEDMRRSLQNIAQHLGDNLQGSASVAGTPAAQGMPGMAPSPPSGPETASTRLDTIRQAQAILTRGTGVTGSNGLPFQGTSANKPDSAVGHFLTELREATHKAKGGVPEGYTAEARLAALVQPYLPGSSLNFKV
jgi:hypothetical protein